MTASKYSGAIAFGLCALVAVGADIVRSASGEQARVTDAQEAGRSKRVAALPSQGEKPAVVAGRQQDRDATESTTIASETSAGPLVALVIGNAAYTEDDAPLVTPVNDARSLGGELRARGFDVEVAENLGKVAMERAIERFEGKITPGTTALLFYSGHGVQVGRESFLVPVSARIWKAEDVRRDGIALDKVVSAMNDRGAKAKLVVVDASRRNPFERRLRGVSTGITPMGGPEGTAVISAVAPGKVVDDVPEGNSLFVRELIGHIRSPGATAEAAFHRTRVSVAKASGGAQVPAVFSALVDDVGVPPTVEKPSAEKPAPEPRMRRSAR